MEWSNISLLITTALVSLVLGTVLGGVIVYKYVFKKRLAELQKQTDNLDKEQIRNMMSAMGQKPSEEHVNRIISMAENMKKKKEGKKEKKKK